MLLFFLQQKEMNENCSHYHFIFFFAGMLAEEGLISAFVRKCTEMTRKEMLFISVQNK